MIYQRTVVIQTTKGSKNFGNTKRMIPRSFASYWITIMFLLLTTACTEQVKQAEPINRLPHIYPDYIGVTIPEGIAPLNFHVLEPSIEKVDIHITGSQEGELHVQDQWAKFNIKEWRKLTKANQGGSLNIQVQAKRKDGQWQVYKDFKIYVSENPLEDYGLTYRRIQPGYEVGGNIGIYQRDLHSFEEIPLMQESAVPGRCFNCHTPNRTNPEVFTLQVRGEGGGTLVQKDGVQTWYNTKTEQTKAAGSYASWHPDGRYCAYAANAVHQSFFVGKDRNIEVYHSFSNIVVLDTQTGELIVSPLLNTEALEIFPAFSADGKTLFFSTSENCNVPAEYEKVKCSLCAIPFDAETGSFGNQVDTLLHGPTTDKSYIQARPSYDGRWLMYVRAERSNFPVSQKEADLWLMDLQTGKVRSLDEANSPQTESYPNWSSNSQWFVFSSKRQDGLHSWAYIAGIDKEGKVTKPFLLPQENPLKYYRNMFDSFNCPDFTSTQVDFDVRIARENLFSNDRVQVKIKE